MMRRIAAILLLLSFVLSLHGVSAQADPEETYKAIIRQAIDQAYNHGNVAPISEHFAPAYLEHPGETGRLDLMGAALGLRAAMPDLQATLELLIAEGAWVAVRLHLLGTFVNELVFPNVEPVPPTGQPVELVVNRVFRFNEDGQVIEAWDGFDNLSYLAQIGLLPTPTEAPVANLGVVEVLPTALEAQHRATVLTYFEAVNQGTLPTLAGAFSADYAAHNPFGLFDFAGQVDDLNALRSALPDLTLTVEQVIVEGDWVGALYTLQGTFTSAYVLPEGSVPPTGGAVELPVIAFFHFDGQGTVLESWELYDGLSFLSQLGLSMAPAPDQ